MEEQEEENDLLALTSFVFHRKKSYGITELLLILILACASADTFQEKCTNIEFKLKFLNVEE